MLSWLSLLFEISKHFSQEILNEQIELMANTVLVTFSKEYDRFFPKTVINVSRYELV